MRAKISQKYVKFFIFVEIFDKNNGGRFCRLILGWYLKVDIPKIDKLTFIRHEIALLGINP